MSIDLSRREFLKLATLSAASTVGACVPLNSRTKDILEPHVLAPEDILPGDTTYYASTCRQCPAGCGIIVGTINGRAKKIEGNPAYPINRGKLCARGQAGLQDLYHPDRLRNAVKQSGGRGSRKFEALHWEDAIALLIQKLAGIDPARVSFLGGKMPDHLYFLSSRWLEAMGAPPLVRFNLQSTFDGRITASKAAQSLFGSRQLPIYDIANAEVIFSFGANFLDTWQSPVAYSQQFGEFRQEQAGGRGFFVQFEPRLSSTAASADEWVPLRPGTDGLVALALGRIIVENGLGHVGTFSQEEADQFRDVNVRELAEASQVHVEKLEQLALILASADRPLVIPGGYPAGQKNGFASYKAIQGLNLILRRIGQRGGVYLSQPSPIDTLPGAPAMDSFMEIMALIERMNSGEVEVLLIHGANPVYELPSAAGFVEAVNRVPFVVSFSSIVDETAVQSDLILPDHSYLETWGYQVASPGGDRPSVSSQQPVVQPLYDTRSTGNLILALAEEQGGEVAEALPWANELLFLEDASGGLFLSSLSPYNVKTAGDFWSAWRQFGGWWTRRELYQEPDVTGFFDQPLKAIETSFEGASEEYPYHLYPYSGVALGDGSCAHLPWLQELPDPMTTACWQTWVEINPQTAHSIGVKDNEIVKVVSPHGEITAVVVVYPGIRPDVIAVPIGQGHTDSGRYAANRGANPMQLLAAVSDEDSGELAWGATRVRVEPTGESYELARLESLEGEGRETIR
jgi:anaerobic selenocysteine-containing dehydrogenase